MIQNNRDKSIINCPYTQDINLFVNTDLESNIIIKMIDGSLYPVVLMNNEANKISFTNQIKSNSQQILDLKDIAKRSCFPKLDKEKYKTKYNLDVSYFGAHYYYIIQEHLSNSYKVVGQYIPKNSNSCIGLIIMSLRKKRKFYVPVRSQKSILGLEIVNNFPRGNLQTVVKFIYNIKKYIEISINSYLYDLDKNYIEGVSLSTGATIIVEPFKNINKFKNVKRIVERNYNLDDVENAISGKIINKDNRIEGLNKEYYYSEIYNLLRLELSKTINNERDKTMRDKLFKLIANKHWKSDLNEIENINDDDRDFIKDILRTTLTNEEKRKLFNEKIFNFDSKTRESVENIINSNKSTPKEKRKELLNLIEKLLTNKIIITQNKKDSIPDSISNIRNICSIYESESKCNSNINCLWNSNGCKFVVSRENYDYYINKIIEELVKSDIKRNELLQNQIDIVINRNKYQREIPKLFVRFHFQ